MAVVLNDFAHQTSNSIWPPDPYKGLTYYDYGDFPLFAGRTADVARVGRILGDGSTRILLLHGVTGCGKSSFLRAALIPSLEQQAGRFRFAKKTIGAEAAMFVRSSHDPLFELAVKAWEMVQAVPANEPTPEASSPDPDFAAEKDRPVHPYARGPLIDSQLYPVINKFTAAVSEDPELLVDTFGRMAFRAPRTQAIVVDQGEELMTLKPGPDGNQARRRFFMFLSMLTRSEINYRLIVAFRTEFHGRLFASLKAAQIEPSAVGDYFLAELTERDLVEAIKRPTIEDDVPGYGVPRKHYRFYYQKGLEEKIAKELTRTPLSGGLLPVLQIVCRRLYVKAKSSPPIDDYYVVRHKDFDTLSIQGQVDVHLQQGLVACCTELKTGRYNPFFVTRETMRWRDVLCELAKLQADGTVTTDVLSKKKLSDLRDSKGCSLPFDEVLRIIQLDEWKIVRPVELTSIKGVKLESYSLGHDVLGGVLQNWKNGRKEDRASTRRSLVVIGLVLLVLAFAISSPAVAGPVAAILISEVSKQELAIIPYSLGVVGFLFFLLALVPEDSIKFQFVNRRVYDFMSNLRAKWRLPN